MTYRTWAVTLTAGMLLGSTAFAADAPDKKPKTSAPAKTQPGADKGIILQNQGAQGAKAKAPAAGQKAATGG